MFKDFLIEELDQVVVQVPESEIPERVLLNEGRWVASGKKDWMVRVDPADPNIPTQRHVHIAREKHTSAKNMQASWNEDKSRHDKGSFNASIGAMSVVQDLARDALGLPSDAILEHVLEARPQLLLESEVPEDALSIVYLEVK